MPVGEVIGIVLLVIVVVIALLAWRRIRVIRQGGVDVALRSRPDLEASRWHLGIARYRGDEFVWYRVTSLRSGSNIVVNRGDLAILARRSPAGSEAYAMPSGAVILRCRTQDDGDVLELAMAPDTLTGFLSWLESAPPGSVVPWAS